MDTVTEGKMARAMEKSGGIAIFHRFMSVDKLEKELEYVPIYARYISVGVDLEKMWPKHIFDNVQGVCLDVAHAHHKRVGDVIDKIIELDMELAIIAGNVATIEGAKFLLEHGCSVVKAGIGAGSACSTRIKTGHGVPNFSCIMEIARLKQEYNFTLIADGGIRNGGDIAKAIAAGANLVMLGSMLAGTNEAPGTIVKHQGVACKEYRGMASFNAQRDKGNESPRSIEGVSTFVPLKGPVTNILESIKWDLRSALSYSGAKNISEFQQKAKMIRVSSATAIENTPHIAPNSV
jgi:IMP dehydrogenase